MRVTISFSIQNGLSEVKQGFLPSRMPRCQAFKADNAPCTRNASRQDDDTHPEHVHLCTQHKRKYHEFVQRAGGIQHTPGFCYHLGVDLVDGRRVIVWCPLHPPEGHVLCAAHEHQRVERIRRREEAQNDRITIAGLVQGIVEQEPPVHWQRAVRALAEMGGVRVDLRRAAALEYYEHPRAIELDAVRGFWHMARFREYWDWAVGGQVGPEPVFLAVGGPPPPREGGLAALARDNQNVHREEVSRQTNKATEKLLAVKVPDTQQTEKTLTLVWVGGLGVAYHKYLRVANDVNKWFNTKECRAPNDNLYRRLLRGLVALIGSERDEERKTEMYRRCWEECYEALGMCCEGHISRLCNVLVGFDDSFQPPVAFGEILQSKMSAIANMEVSEEEKRKLANAFFDEYATPVEERKAWLEAF